MFFVFISCQNQWIFLHYHKTGAIVSQEIGRAISSNRFNFYEDIAKRKNFKPNQMNEIVISHAGNLLFNWTKIFVTSSLPFQYRIVHFIRDPYDMILSGLLYHAQSPPPEHWLTSDSLHPCSFDEDQIMKFISIIVTYHSQLSKSKLKQTIQKISNLCYEIYTDSTRIHGTSNYHRTLSKLLSNQFSSYKAIQLEACRSIISKFSGAGGDILRMAANSVREGQAMFETSNLSKRIFLSEFLAGNKTQSLHILTELFQFLLTPSSSGNDFWKNKITLEEAIRLGFAASYVDTIPSRNSILSSSSPSSSSPSFSSSRFINHPRRLLSSSNSNSELPFSQPNWMQSCKLNSYDFRDNLSQNRILSLLPKEVESTAQLSKSEKFQLRDRRNKPTINTQKQTFQRQSIHQNNHITQGIWSQEKRKSILCFLSQDPILSPILNLVNIILHNPTTFNSTSSTLAILLSKLSE